MSISRRRYTQEFKNQLIEEVIELSKPIAEIARDYGIAAQPLAQLGEKYRVADYGDTHGEHSTAKDATAQIKR